MRFYEKGPTLPDELLFAQDEGRVIFFCGSGVSMARAGLPDFMGLAKGVLHKLGAATESEAMKVLKEMEDLQQRSGVQGLLAADVIFGLLTRDFVPRDINQAVAQCLVPAKQPALTAHNTLLRLARQQDGATRLVTTNFDLLFEACSPTLKSRTRSDLPNVPYGDDDWGIVHLHGKLKSDYSGPEADGLVLSSAEFGDAYLAQGWARDFVHGVLTQYTPVFVGYSADDPPVRYLLEGLRQTRDTRHKLYAFQSGANEEAIARWSDKGVEAIVYDPKNNHYCLWQTLHAWAQRNDDPNEWRSKVFSLAQRGPAKLRPHQRGMVAHIVSSKTGALALRKEEPPLPADWLCAFDPVVRYHEPWSTDGLLGTGKTIDPFAFYHLDSDPPRLPKDQNRPFESPIPEGAWDAFAINAKDKEEIGDGQIATARGYYASESPMLPARLNALGNWIGKISNEPVAVWWAGLQHAIHPEILKGIRLFQPDEQTSEVADVVSNAWRQVFELNEKGNLSGHKSFLVGQDIKSGGWSPSIVRQYVSSIAPTLKNKPTYSPPPTRSRKRVTVKRLVNIEVSYSDFLSNIAVPDEYLAAVVDKQRTNVELAIDFEQEFSGWVNVCAIEPEEKSENQDFARTYELSGYVMHFVGLVRRLIEIDPKAARLEILRWRRTDLVFARLRFWAFGHEALADGSEFAEEILTMSDETFWASRNRRDLLLALKKRWGDIPEKDLKKIEERILAGPKRTPRARVKSHEEHSARIRLNCLHWLANQGCSFSFDLEKETQRLRKKDPDWRPEFSEVAAASLDTRSGWVKTETDWNPLKDVPLAQVCEAARKAQGRNHADFTEKDPFLGLCKEAPIKALGALKVASQNGQFYQNFWEKFLDPQQRKNDSQRLRNLIAGRLVQVPLSDFSTILLAASRWFKMTGPEIKTSAPDVFERVLSHFLKAIEKNPKQAGYSRENKAGFTEWLAAAINAPAGNLAELLLTDSRLSRRKPAQGFPPDWLAQVKKLLGLPGFSRQHSLAIFSQYLNWFYAFHPSFTEEAFLKILELPGPISPDGQAIWLGFFQTGGAANLALYQKLKPQFLKIVPNAKNFGTTCARILPGVLLAGWGLREKEGKRVISSGDLRAALLKADEEFRCQMLWELGHWTEGDNQQWRNELLEFLSHVWPKQKIVRTPKVSARLCDLALRQKDNFPAVADVIVQLVSKIERGDMLIHTLLTKTDSKILVHPRHTLKLLHAVLPDDAARWPYGTNKALQKLVKTDSEITNDPQFKELQRKLSES